MDFSTVLESLKKLSSKDKTEILQYFLDEEYHAKIDLSYCVECDALGSVDPEMESEEFLKCKECDETFCEECSKEKMYKTPCKDCGESLCKSCVKKNAEKCEKCQGIFCGECKKDISNEKICNYCINGESETETDE